MSCMPCKVFSFRIVSGFVWCILGGGGLFIKKFRAHCLGPIAQGSGINGAGLFKIRMTRVQDVVFMPGLVAEAGILPSHAPNIEHHPVS